ncbi:hypothetical protein AAU57_14710 [Nonlabens sp. YIK11]|uniref:nucleotidyl transferase AbiEii/AbiGii toxin family protein n=1 Tax=Nonlabens sp. YIK11 TaxID=1453349 RepID=UPI0006DC086C|nr:nucleotidyl transferase AbiEii/AbiGii toxin family protein [Nonlabens sp. YIK11]KQC31861.1 hypothetical protein AAU57_14710 [Nonlabens sp. YIK11]
MLDKIKMLTIRALMNDRKLMYGLALKGGNALQLVYDITDRASMDIDYSMKGDFTEEEFLKLQLKIEVLLNDEFNKEGLIAFDAIFIEKPKSSTVLEWKGYNLKFKITTNDLWFEDDLDKTRRNAIKIAGQSTKFSVDISSYEYIDNAIKVEREGVVMLVYTPEMIVIEKLRALCQSIPEYKNIVATASPKGRARDFYDIWNIHGQHGFDISAEKNTQIIKEVFAAKRVPLEFLKLIPEYKDLQKENWPSVADTLSSDDKGFDFYYDYTLRLIKQIKIL